MPSAHWPRAAKAKPKGLPLTSILLTAVRTSSPGKAPSMRLRFLLISRILLTCSMSAGQTSWQARQVVQAQRASWRAGFDQVAGRVAFGQLADLLDDLHGRKRLFGGIGRAAVLTAFAGGAGVGVENVFPGQVGDGRRAVLLDALVFQVDGGDRAFGLQRRQKGVGAGGEDMAQLGVGNGGDEAQRQDEVKPPEHRVHRPQCMLAHAGEQLGRQQADGREGRQAGVHLVRPHPIPIEFGGRHPGGFDKETGDENRQEQGRTSSRP